MEEYLHQAGFIKQVINNYKNNYYLFNKLDGNDIIMYAKTNGIRQLIKSHFGVNINICPCEMFILRYSDRLSVKIIDDITTLTKLKQVPYLQKMYETQLNSIPNIDIKYAIKINMKTKEEKILNVLKSFDIRIVYTPNELDCWLDE